MVSEKTSRSPHGKPNRIKTLDLNDRNGKGIRCFVPRNVIQQNDLLSSGFSNQQLVRGMTLSRDLSLTLDRCRRSHLLSQSYDSVAAQLRTTGTTLPSE